MKLSRLTISILVCMVITDIGNAAERMSPVDFGTLTSSRGYRRDPLGSGRFLFHNGWDIAVPTGTPVYPTAAGIIYFAGWYKGYGYTVVVDHGIGGWVSLYGHNSKLLVSVGQRVDTTTPLALAGSTGKSTGPHVHLEYRRFPGGRSPFYPTNPDPSHGVGEMVVMKSTPMGAEAQSRDSWVDSWLGGKQ